MGGKAFEECLIIFCRSLELIFGVKDEIGSILIRLVLIDKSFIKRRLSIRMTSIGGLVGCMIDEDGRGFFFVAKYIHIQLFLSI